MLAGSAPLAAKLEGHALTCPKYLVADGTDALQFGMTSDEDWLN
jgi:hypothetical protein